MMRVLYSTFFVFLMTQIFAQSVVTRKHNPIYDIAVSEEMVVWTEHDGMDYELSMYDEQKIVQITNNTSQDVRPVVFESSVAWINTKDSVVSIMLYTRGHMKRVFSSNRPIKELCIDSNYVSWLIDVNGYTQVYFSDGKKINKIDEAPTLKSNLAMSGKNLVWREKKESSYEIVMYQGFKWQLTTNYTDEYEPYISGEKIVWRGYSEKKNWELFMFNGEKVVQLTENIVSEYEPRIVKDVVVWRAHDGFDYEIYMKKGDSEEIQITDNEKFDGAPLVTSSGNVIWSTYDGNDYEIFMYNGREIEQLTNNQLDDVEIKVSDRKLAWKIKELDGGNALGYIKTK